MPVLEGKLRQVTCDYCEGDIERDDEDSATWAREARARKRSRFGFGYEPPPVMVSLLLCAKCRDVVSVARLLELLERAIDDYEEKREAGR
ncbi:MAG: hypothetical protein ABIR60_08615 [Allosphingosinicella sp.]